MLSADIPAPGEALYPPRVTPPDAPLPLGKLFRVFVANPLRGLPRSCYEEDITVIRPSPRLSIAWVTAPHLIEQVLLAEAHRFHKSEVEKRVFSRSLRESVLTSDGNSWRWQRRVLAPLFRPTEVAAYVPAMAVAAEAQAARWRASPGVRDIERDMMRTTFDVILATMLTGNRPAEAEAVMSGGADFLARISWELAYAVLKMPRWLPHPASWQMSRAARRMRTAVTSIVRRRARDPGAAGDLLSRLIAARDPETGEPMGEEMLVNNVLTLLEAGHETTAKALTWTLYLLARAPRWQDRVRAEVEAVCATGPVEAQHVDKLVITQQVLKETMRLYPPAPVIGRDCDAPVEIAGHQLPAGSQIVIPIWALHRHLKLWDDPDRFDPDRFRPAREAKIARTQYMPFGAGPRICIGSSFAMTEATVLLATFVLATRFGWDGRHTPEPISRVTLRPKGGMPLEVASA